MSTLSKYAYWQKITGKRILIIGPTPPPLGGVAVHVTRVASYLREQHNCVEIFHSEPRGRSALFRLYAAYLQYRIKKYKPTDIHYHGTYLPNSDRELTLLGNLQQRFNFELTIVEHDCRHLYARSAAYIGWYRNFVRTHAVKLMLVGNTTMECYADLAISNEHAMQTHAFLPPSLQELPAALTAYPEQLWQHNIRSNPLLIMNAFACIPHGTSDLYGIHDAIVATLALRKQQPYIGLCIIFATVGDASYLHRLYRLAQQAGGTIFFLIGNYPLWPLLYHADIFIRPTYSDGDSVSVREALWAGIPVIASNVCVRPEGVTTYDPLQPDALRSALSSR